MAMHFSVYNFSEHCEYNGTIKISHVRVTVLGFLEERVVIKKKESINFFGCLNTF